METKVCKKCGQELSVNCFNKASKNKDGLYHMCKQCYSEHRKATGVDKKYFDNHKEKIKEYRQTEQYKINNKKRKQTIEYKQKEKEYKQRPEVKERNKQSDKKRRQNPEYQLKHNMRNHQRREKERQGEGIQSLEIAQEILNEWFNNTCAYSGIEITNETLNWDHIIPLKKDGVNEIWNLIPSYNSYNSSKGAI